MKVKGQKTNWVGVGLELSWCLCVNRTVPGVSVGKA